MKLYFLSGTDPDDITNDLSLFVRATDGAFAIAYWLAYYPDIHGYLPDVREVPPVSDQPGAIDWELIPVII